ncbi:retrovirus-related Pol polyprotein from transposon 17.6 [Trichonephila clavipes]|nr:retrovirus-related Pol polyprotein from transposon 17.6 [Trichonephila clavipes]
MNETTQLSSRNETTQLVSRNETTQICTAVDCLQPPAPPLQQNRLFLPTLATLDLLGPYPVSRVRRNRYVLVITDHVSKWADIIPLKKASARVIADNFFDNYISRFGAPIKLISDNGPQFISDIFENLSERDYRPQANRTECVNRDLVQMIANYVNEQHDTWDQFLREFAYAIRTAVNETTGKTPAELFLDRKLITPFQKLVMVSDGTEFAVGDIERLFEEARRNTKTKHKKWEKYYNRRRRDVQIKVNDWCWVTSKHSRKSLSQWTVVFITCSSARSIRLLSRWSQRLHRFVRHSER